ncbi:hypothetical protein SAMN05421678_13033 [Actinopolymorpha cephalotaxi]|uniref:Integral membrane protein n=1 Tax=Actinopolymorpha cephalotaxi TaxID=504797 RepID=A0A1I3C8A5_9ACTN|nr:hypothetical protein [Actinopolymorpha cephalotaxi]NYH86854.1 hypothetical protein [Actinopolymorpha cephalotaxi]SFH70774.1 hypothetical protein SAMN05421678_13033 [Actinopolymorpha cephalotaxi]
MDDSRLRDGTGADLLAVTAGVVLLAAAIVVGRVLLAHGVPLHAPAAPLLGFWQPRVAATTPLTCAVAALVIGYGPTLAGRLRWRWTLTAAWATSLAWILSLALVDGWARLAERLPKDYLGEIPAAPPWPELLRTYADRIVGGQPNSWTTHVAGHPPATLGFFVLLDRIGLSGGSWAAITVMVLGSTAPVAVAVTLRFLDGEDLARRALPFLVLGPTALWIGVSADAMFLAVSAWGIALLAAAIRLRGVPGVLAAVGGGLVLGLSLYLSYGLAVFGLVALAVLAVGRRWRPLLVAGVGVLAVVVAFTASGFFWWEGYDRLVVRYYQGWGGERPYSYWVWADLAALLLCVGLAVPAGLRRVLAVAGHSVRTRSLPRAKTGTCAVVLAVMVAVLASTLSGLSKAEVERIWLPFALWLVAACALLPVRTHRAWLALQALTALAVQHLVLTSW